MTEGKEIWRDIYILADNLAINHVRLKYLVEDLIGKQRAETEEEANVNLSFMEAVDSKFKSIGKQRAETEEEANVILSFLEAVDSKFKSRTITVDEAIEEAKREFKKDSRGEVQAQETLGEPTDAEVEKIGEELEEEVRVIKDIEEIRELCEELEISYDNLKTIMRGTYEVESVDDLSAEQAEDLKHFLMDKRDKRKGAVEAEVVEEEHWDKTVEIDEGTFMFREDTGYIAGIPTDVLLCRNGANDNVYELKVDVPKCSCKDFEINKQEREFCKHLKAASVAGYKVSQLPEIPEDVSKALVNPEKKKRAKAKKEELVKVTMFGKEATLEVQVPTEIIKSEDQAVELIKGILGAHPAKENVIQSYAGIEELSAEVILALSQAIGIRYIPLVYEKEEVKMSIGDVYLATANEEQKRKYEAVAKMLPEVNIVTHCRITTIAGWKDKSGNVRFAAGTKEEYLTPYELQDISKRSSAFLLTKCETKSAKKAILNCLPVTGEGLLQKIKEVYKWV